MAETDKKIEAMEQEVSEVANPQADAPKKNAVAAEPTHLKNDAQDLGPAVVKPTDSNPDASKSTKPVSGDAQQKSAGAADATPKLKGESKETEKTPDDKEEKSEMMHDKDAEKKDMKASYKKEESELDIKADVDALIGDADLSEEFKEKAATIFETAIKAKVKEESQRLQGEYETKLKEDTSLNSDLVFLHPFRQVYQRPTHLLIFFKTRCILNLCAISNQHNQFNQYRQYKHTYINTVLTFHNTTKLHCISYSSHGNTHLKYVKKLVSNFLRFKSWNIIIQYILYGSVLCRLLPRSST